MADSESMSLEATNKVRIELGMAPLAGEADGDTVEDVDDPDAIAEANWTERRQAEAAARAEKETRERIAKARNQRDLRTKLQGKGLGEADDGSAEKASAISWVKQSRKREKQRLAEMEKLKQREKELEERDGQASYGEDDLAGLKVAHDTEQFEEGKDVVLTLSDKKILDEQDDELQNVNLAEYARTNERMNLKTKGKNAYKYTGYDDDEFQGSSGDPSSITRGVLSKYDSVIGEDANKISTEGFRLGGLAAPGPSSAGTANAAARKARQEKVALEQQRLQNRQLLSLETQTTESTPYAEEDTTSFKKSKKKKNKDKNGKSSSRRAAAPDDEETITNYANGDALMGDGEEGEQKLFVPTAERRLAKEAARANGSALDDDELQSALARQRRAATRKRIQQIRGEDIAQQIMDEQGRNGMPAMAIDDGSVSPVLSVEEKVDAVENGLVLDDTSEFIRNISSRPLVGATVKRENGASTPGPALASSTRPQGGFTQVKSEQRDNDVLLKEYASHDREEGEAGDEADEEYEEGMAIDGEEADLRDGRSAIANARPKEDGTDTEAFGTASEQFVSGGLASTIALLKQSGLVKPQSAEEAAREKAYRDKERFIAEARQRANERETDRALSKAAGSNKTDSQREYENKQRATVYAQQDLEAFRNYKPDVEIKYTDEFGRNMTPKEAWKDLSHKFSGKGSGTGKRNKLLKKIAEEKKREAMASGDTPLSVNSAFQARQERMGSATMVIGVGNRNNAPTADQLLGASSATSGSRVRLDKNKVPTSSAGNITIGGPVAKKPKLQPRVLG